MAPRERFGAQVAGLACPVCMSKSYTVVARRDPKRGLMQSIYRCEGCKSFFGDSAEGSDPKRETPPRK
jgi:hypothetical protein